MNNSLKKAVLLVLVLMATTLNAISFAFGWFDTLSYNQNETVTIGNWDFGNGSLSTAVAFAIESYINDQIAQDPNSDLQSVYDQSGNLSNSIAFVDGITFNNITWNFTGTGTSTQPSTLGYVSLVDRSLDGTSSPVHAILPPAPTTPVPYPGYNYFLVYDAKNLLTDNQYSLRLNYGVTLQTSSPVSNVTQITFYGSVGLTDPSDTGLIANNRNMTVSVSVDGINWTTLGVDVPSAPTGTEFNFTQYSYNVPLNLQTQDIFVRISYEGETRKVGKDKLYSRLIIDQLEIITN